MYNLYIINIPYSSNFQSNILNIIFILSLLCGILVIISKNPIISILYLIGLFSNISFYLIMLGLSFICLSYLIIYIGAVSILFLFILMLINIRISELQSDTNNSIPLTIIIGISLSYSLFQLLPYDIAVLSNFNSNLNNDLFGFSFNKEDNNSNFIFNTNKYKDLFFTTSKI